MNIDNKTAEWLTDYVKVVGTRKFYNTKRREFLPSWVFNGDLRDQIHKNGNVSKSITSKYLVTKGLIQTMTVDEIDEMNQDTVYRFGNSRTQIFFVGTRKDLCEAYDLNIDKVTYMIKRPDSPRYRSWVVGARNVKGLETSNLTTLCESRKVKAKEVILQLPHVINMNKWTRDDEPILNTISGWCGGDDSTANEVAKGMIAHGANINGKDRKGCTALMVAMLHGKKTQLIKTLISSGADVHAKDKDGKTAWDYMQKNRSLIGTSVYRELQSLQHAA